MIASPKRSRAVIRSHVGIARVGFSLHDICSRDSDYFTRDYNNILFNNVASVAIIIVPVQQQHGMACAESGKATSDVDHPLSNATQARNAYGKPVLRDGNNVLNCCCRGRLQLDYIRRNTRAVALENWQVVSKPFEIANPVP